MSETDDPLFAGAGEMAALMRARDWASTPLGPPERWPQSLRTVVRIVLTSRHAMWLGWGPDLIFFYNDAYRPTLGTKHPAALGTPTRLVWAEIWPAIEPRITRVLHHGEATWDEGLLLFLERSGYPEETYHTFSYSPVPGDDGASGGLLCVVTEETDRVIGERRRGVLRELAAELTAHAGDAGSSGPADVFAALARCLASHTHDLPFTLAYRLDSDGRRARLVTTTGINAEHPAADHLAPPEQDLAAASPWPLADLLGDGAPRIVELPGAHEWPRGPWPQPARRALVLPIAQPGQARPVGVFIAGLNPHRTLDDAYHDFLRLLVDQLAASLANAQAYEAERRRAEALAELDRAKTQFFGNVSHEFRTPLTLMLGPLEGLVADPQLPPDVHEQLARVHRNGRRLLKLVNTMLDFSRIEAGRVHAEFAPHDLAELTADLASTFRSATDAAGLRLIIDCPPLAEPVHVDRDMWEKIVLNLLSNAFKYTLAGEIHVLLRREGPRVALDVRDTGLGIPAADLPHLFERFYRAESGRGRTHEGTGIGLALVQELVKLHGGDVSVTSEPGSGSTFTVRLPLGSDHLPAEQVRSDRPAHPDHAAAFLDEAHRWLPDESGAATTAPGSGAHAVTSGRGRIVLADDNADMRDYLRRLLAPRWDVEAVANGSAALHAVRRRAPDLVITDVMMPELDGFGLLAALRESPTTSDIPVLVLSARAGEDARLEGLQAGASDYLVKPFSARELAARVEALVLRNRLRVAAATEAERLASVFAQAPVGIAILRGPLHVFEIANPSYLELVGGRPVLGKPIRQALPEIADQGIHELLDTVYRTGEPFVGRSYPLTLRRPPHPAPIETFFDFVYQPLRDPAGQVEGIAVVCFDVGELARARRDADAANRAKDEFLAMLGHELRNPLAPILTALQLMRLKAPPGVDKERAIIERQVKHLVGLVDDLLDVSRITGGKIELRRERVELARVVARAIEMASPLLEQQRHDLQVAVPRQGLALDADPGRLAQVVSNLLTNAAKYTRSGGRITVEGATEDDTVLLRVRDTGIGIDPAVLPHIFKPFTQERQAIDRSQGGLGLGLAIVRSLVDLHGGSVSAHSEGRGLGAEFIVRLPRAGIHALTAAPRERRPPGAAVPASDALRILVVDDNEDAATSLAEALDRCGYTVRVAHDGPGALAIADAFTPDVAVLDLGLPVMDGYELAQRIADHPHPARIRLIAVTGYGQDHDRARSLAAGFHAHLVKPVDLDHLRATIATLRRET